MELCNLSPDSLDMDNNFKWEVATFEGSWRPGDTAGGCRNYLDTFANNPQYLISLEVSLYLSFCLSIYLPGLLETWLDLTVCLSVYLSNYLLEAWRHGWRL